MEGKGVSPNEAIDLSSQALKEGRDPQLEKGLQLVRTFK